MPAAFAASTNCCAAGTTGERTETPSGPSGLCASWSTTMSPLGWIPSDFLKYGRTSAEDQPSPPASAQESKSPGWPRTYAM